MKIRVDEELLAIFREIQEHCLSSEEWAAIESDDMFQSSSYVGGFDADEDAFCFSWYDGTREFWFQLTLDQIRRAVSSEDIDIEGRLAE